LSVSPRRLGRYEIVRPLARGGMAELFLARKKGIEGFEKLVVIKRILPELKHDREFVEMFLDEARLQATLHHSNIVQVYDFGEDAGSHFFAMEYLHGEDTRAIMRAAHRRGERVPLEHALSVVLGVCAGLHYAHEKLDGDGKPLGIVHRDVSPQNVAVTYDGGVKVMDFGIAKARRRTTETRGGTLKGKLQYMAPEQCLGEEVDRRTDVFAIGILLWELTCTRRLYFGQSDFAIMKAITEHDAAPPSEVVSDYPAELEAIVLRALARRREERHQTAEELQLQLEAFARERRLALSPVGLARYLRELFSGRVEAWSTAMRGGTQAIESFVISRIEERDQTHEDDDPTAIELEPLEPSASGVVPRRQTLAVGRPPVRRARWPWAAGAAVASALALGGGGWLLLRQTAAPSSAPALAAPPARMAAGAAPTPAPTSAAPTRAPTNAAQTPSPTNAAQTPTPTNAAPTLTPAAAAALARASANSAPRANEPTAGAPRAELDAPSVAPSTSAPPAATPAAPPAHATSAAHDRATHATHATRSHAHPRPSRSAASPAKPARPAPRPDLDAPLPPK
jgi:serine/threonine protein kinase